MRRVIKLSLISEKGDTLRILKTHTVTCFPLAKSAIDFRAVLPERVLGKASTELTNLKAATGPTSSLTRRMASLLISSTDFLLAAKRKRKVRVPQLQASRL